MPEQSYRALCRCVVQLEEGAEAYKQHSTGQTLCNRSWGKVVVQSTHMSYNHTSLAHAFTTYQVKLHNRLEGMHLMLHSA